MSSTADVVRENDHRRFPEGQSSGSRRGILWDVISLLCRLGVAAVWLVAGVVKTQDRLLTIQSVASYEILSPSLTRFVGMWIGPLEIILGLFILFGVFLRFSALLSAIILGIYIVAIVSAWDRGLTIDCGCFSAGGFDPTVTGWNYLGDILRDLGYIVMSLWTVKWPFRKFAIYA